MTRFVRAGVIIRRGEGAVVRAGEGVSGRSKLRRQIDMPPTRRVRTELRRSRPPHHPSGGEIFPLSIGLGWSDEVDLKDPPARRTIVVRPTRMDARIATDELS